MPKKQEARRKPLKTRREDDIEFDDLESGQNLKNFLENFDDSSQF